LHLFPEEKSEHWIKPDSKFLFHFVDILGAKIFTEGILDISFYRSINQIQPSTAIKKSIFSLFLGKKCCINQNLNDI